MPAPRQRADPAVEGEALDRQPAAADNDSAAVEPSQGGHEPGSSGGDAGEAHRPEKRQRIEAHAGGDASPPPPPPPPPDPAEPTTSSDGQVAAALARITSHISNPKKFPKASPLLRQLIEGGALGRPHRRPLFTAVKVCFVTGDHAGRVASIYVGRSAWCMCVGALGRGQGRMWGMLWWQRLGRR